MYNEFTIAYKYRGFSKVIVVHNRLRALEIVAELMRDGMNCVTITARA